MRDNQQFNPTGGLNTDTSVEYIQDGDYVDAKNIQHITNSTESTQSQIPKVGNELAFTLGSTVAQNKTWRVYVTDTSPTANVNGLFLFDQNGVAIPSGAINWNADQTVTLQAAALLAAIPAAYSPVVTTDNATYIDITFTVYLGYDWGLIATTKVGGAPAVTDTALVTVIVKEAYDLTLAGELNIIASNDTLGDLYILSTPQKKLPEVQPYSITTVVNSGAAFFRYAYTTSTPHGLISGQRIVVRNVDVATAGVGSPNGIQLITVTGASTFEAVDLYGTAVGFTQGVAGGKITLYEGSVGEIGAAVKNLDTGVWVYNGLLRTKEWDFRTKYQADFRVSQRTEIKDSLYWTNNDEVPRVFYYTKPFSTNGALSINGGRYEYGSIAEETKLILSSTDTRVEFDGQVQAGGAVASGNWRYSVRLVSDSLSSTEWSDLTNPVNVFLAATNGAADLIIGDEEGTTTGKINKLKVTGLVAGLFKYIELAGVNYVGSAIDGYIIKRILLDPNDTELDIEHTGTETDVVDLDLGTLNFKSAPIITAKSMDVIDSRLVLSNLTIAQQVDFSAWAQTFTHILFKKSIDSVKNNNLNTLRLGEYQDPENVNNFAGYMQNETYRFAVKVKFKDNGFESQSFHIDDVIFDTNPTNSASTDPSRRTAGLPDFNLSDSTGALSPNFDTTTVYVPYIQFGDINLDFEIDGVKVRDLIERISIERAEVTFPTILACGYAVPSIQAVQYVDAPPSSRSGYAYNGNIGFFGIVPNGAVDGIGEYPFISGRVYTPNNPLYRPPLATTGLGNDPTVVAFHSPDIQFGHTSISRQAGDEFLNHGNPLSPNFTYYNSSPSTLQGSQYGQWSGFFNTVAPNAACIKTNAIDEAVFIPYGGSATLSSGKKYKKFAALFTDQDEYSIGKIAGGMVMECATPLDVFGTQSDYGYYYCQYHRPRANQYGDTNTTKYVSCNSVLEIDSQTPASQVMEVFGGDTFTQLNYFRQRNRAVAGGTFVGTGFIAPTSDVDGFGGGTSSYCQNRINVQMKQKSPTQTGDLYPAISTTPWLETTTNTDGNQGEAYQAGYTIRNQVRNNVAYDPSLDSTGRLEGRQAWSELKPQDSFQDNFRIFLPLNFKDLNSADGAIVHHASINGELFTWQLRRFMKQFFNTRGTLETTISKVVIGDGSVMSRDGLTISLIGTDHKWSIIKGKSTGGNDVLYWINVELKKAVRFGYDGTVSIGDMKGMQSFWANNLKWVVGIDNPADIGGINGVWSDRLANAIWTVRGQREVPVWDSFENYTQIGLAVSYVPATGFSTFNETGEFFLNKVGAGNLGITPVAAYPLPNVILSITGTTLLSFTVATPHLMVTGDTATFLGIAGMGADLNDQQFVVTVTGASTFDITVPLLTNGYVPSSGSVTEIVSKFWDLVPHTNNNYYNEYTIVFNEFKNKFTTFETPMPKIYLKWTDTFLSPRPISNVSEVYEDNIGEILKWYNDGATVQEEEGYIEGVINKGYPETKWFEALAVDSDVPPHRFEFETKNQKSYLAGSEFETREDSSYAPIKEDSTITAGNPKGLNNTNTSLLYGKYLKVKMFFAINTYQRLLDFNVKFRISPRTKNK